MKLSDLNARRKEGFRKDSVSEDFLTELNQHLIDFEQSLYVDADISQPLLFTFGVPRSGTTLVTQVLAHGLDLGYINNLNARFWRAPLTGLRLSQTTGIADNPGFDSTYGSTDKLGEIHDFGYFWRHWLKKDDWQGVKNAKQLENDIDWRGLRLVLANLQNVLGKGMIFKNIFGAYHMKRLKEELSRVFYVYIRRDPLDNALSILQARKNFYSDPSIWWSTMPLEYETLIDKDPFEQVAGQVHYLDTYYRHELNIQESVFGNTLIIEYKDLTQRPDYILSLLADKMNQSLDANVQVVNACPSLPYRTYPDSAEKERFAGLFKRLSDGSSE